MIKIDNTLLQEVGLGGLPDAEKNAFLKHIYETLEMNVGVRLADQMTNEQLDEFEKYFEAKDDAGAFKWLETNFPNYKEIVQEEFDKLKAEVAQTAPQILAASQAAPSVPAQPAADPVAAGYATQPQSATPPPHSQAAPAVVAPVNDPYQPAQPAVGSAPAPAPQPAPAADPQPYQPAASPFPQQPAPQNPTPAPAQPYADPAVAPQSPQPFGAPQAPPAAPDTAQPQSSYQPPFPQQQPPAGPQAPAQ